jgi:hypothetical protein
MQKAKEVVAAMRGGEWAFEWLIVAYITESNYRRAGQYESAFSRDNQFSLVPGLVESQYLVWDKCVPNIKGTPPPTDAVANCLGSTYAKLRP